MHLTLTCRSASRWLTGTHPGQIVATLVIFVWVFAGELTVNYFDTAAFHTSVQNKSLGKQFGWRAGPPTQEN